MRIIAVALLVSLLAACATPQQRAERIIALYGPVCDQLGFARNTDAWRNCVVQSNAADIQAQQASAAAVANVQRAMQPPPRPLMCDAYGCR